MTKQADNIRCAKFFKQLKSRTEIFLVTFAFSIMAVAFTYVFYEDSMFMNNLVISIIIIMGILLISITLSYKKVVAAKLIIDNRIMYLKQAHILDQKVQSSHINKSVNKDIEVFISCFGILIDSKIIKFNLDGVLLKEVQLSDRYITLGYGRDNTVERIRILHETLTIYEMIRIIESFRYETGVTPVLIKENKFL
jgi:archaellum component FlaF (FlaF/FlaG flagellin family)